MVGGTFVEGHSTPESIPSHCCLSGVPNKGDKIKAQKKKKKFHRVLEPAPVLHITPTGD